MTHILTSFRSVPSAEGLPRPYCLKQQPHPITFYLIYLLYFFITVMRLYYTCNYLFAIYFKLRIDKNVAYFIHFYILSS